MTEIAVTAYSRACVHAGRLDLAEDVLEFAESSPQIKKRNRLFLDVIRCYCSNVEGGDVSHFVSRKRLMFGGGWRDTD
jgi:hypothetical protein